MNTAPDPLAVIEHEAIWTGPVRGEDATCVLCSGRWPKHDEDCVLDAALASLKREREAADNLADRYGRLLMKDSAFYAYTDLRGKEPTP